MIVDYLVVGNGIAGANIALQLLENNKTFIVFNSKNIHSATAVSSGLYNPTVLKRFTLVWKAEEHLAELLKTYTYFEELLNNKYLFPKEIYKVFSSENDLNAWNKKAKEEPIKKYLSSKLLNLEKSISSEFPFGEVFFGGKIDSNNLIKDFKKYLEQKALFNEDEFDYNLVDLNQSSEFIQYKNYKVKKIIFCEGFNVLNNPFFNYLPVDGNKGEALIVKLKVPIKNEIYKSKIIISPNKENLNYVGSTYNFIDKDLTKTEDAKVYLTENLSKLYKNSFEILEHIVGIRPTVVDRRPLLGEHPTDKRLVIFNGLGTRGIMNAPLMAKELYEFLEEGKSLSNEISISRFNSKFAKK